MIPGTDGPIFDIMCYNCNRRRHYAPCCPGVSNRVGVSNIWCGHIMAQVECVYGHIQPDWVLLDTCLTDNVINNISLLVNVKNCTENESLKILANGGSPTYTKKGTFRFIHSASYYNPNSIANTSLLKAVADVENYDIVMNTEQLPEIFVIKERILSNLDRPETLYTTV